MVALILFGFTFFAFAMQSSTPAIQCETIPPLYWCTNDNIDTECGFKALCDRRKTAVYNAKINLTLFYESKCGGCQKMITQVIGPQVATMMSDFVNIELVPYGNARMMNGTIVCQHGEEECIINKFESCAINFLSPTKQISYVTCLEQYMMEHGDDPNVFKKAQAKCAKLIDAETKRKIGKCFNGPTGTALQLTAATRTAAAYPEQHKWVPWLLINDISEQVTQGLAATSLPALLCSIWRGDHVPRYCGNFGHEQMREMSLNYM